MNIPNPVLETIYKLNIGAELDLVELRNAMKELLQRPNTECTNVQLGCLLTGLMVKKPTVEELVTVLEASFSTDSLSPYNDLKARIDLPGNANLIGSVGSGKKGVKTVNISTVSSIVAASAGCYIAKPGSSSVSSITGSVDIMREMGVNIDIDMGRMKEVVQKTGFGLFKIEKYLPNFGRLYNNKWFTPHALSFGLAALANPVRVDRLVYGLTHPDVETSLRLLMQFGFNDVMVFSCTHNDIHYIDEIGIYGTTRLVGARRGDIGRLRIFDPTHELGLPRYTPEDIRQGNTVFDNVKLVTDVLAGKGRTALEDIICINASGLLYIDDKVKSLQEGYSLAKGIIQEGVGIGKIENIVNATGGDRSRLRRYL